MALMREMQKVTFSSALKEPALWILVMLSLMLNFVAYQFQSSYFIGPGSINAFAYMGEGWNNVNDGSMNHTWTSTSGTVYLRNFGYTGSDGYTLTTLLYPYPAKPITQASLPIANISIGGKVLGTIDVGNNVKSIDVAVPASLLRSNGPDPAITISSIAPDGYSGVTLVSLSLSSPMQEGFNWPPPLLLMVMTLFFALGYLTFRRLRPSMVSFGAIFPLFFPFALFDFWMRPLVLIVSVGMALLFLILCFIVWRYPALAHFSNRRQPSVA